MARRVRRAPRCAGVSTSSAAQVRLRAQLVEWSSAPPRKTTRAGLVRRRVARTARQVGRAGKRRSARSRRRYLQVVPILPGVAGVAVERPSQVCPSLIRPWARARTDRPPPALRTWQRVSRCLRSIRRGYKSGEYGGVLCAAARARRGCGARRRPRSTVLDAVPGCSRTARGGRTAAHAEIVRWCGCLGRYALAEWYGKGLDLE